MAGTTGTTWQPKKGNSSNYRDQLVSELRWRPTSNPLQDRDGIESIGIASVNLLFCAWQFESISSTADRSMDRQTGIPHIPEPDRDASPGVDRKWRQRRAVSAPA